NHVLLDVDGKRIDLSQKKGSQGVAAPGNCGAIGAGRRKAEGTRWIRRIENVQRFAPDVGPELDRVPVPDDGERVQELGSRSGEVRIRRGGWADLLEAGNCEDRQDRGEGVRRQAGYGDPTVLERGLIEVAAGVAEAKLIQSGRRDGPIVVAHEGVAASD